MKSKYTRNELAEFLTAMQSHFLDHAEEYPALVKVCSSLGKAAKDPSKTGSQPRTVMVTHKGDTIEVTGTTWGAPYYAINKINGVASTKRHNAPGKEYDGEPIYRTCWDKSKKCFVLATSKAQQVVDYFKNAGTPVQEVK